MYFQETLSGLPPSLERSGELFVISRQYPFLMRPLFVAEGERDDVESLAEVDR